MLRQRIITAVVLLALLVPALLTSRSWPFAVLTLALIAAAGWEWARLNGLTSIGAWALGALVAVAALAALAAGVAQPDRAALPWAGVALAWVLGGAWVLARGPAGWPHLPRALRLLLGALLLWFGWLALAQAHGRGLNFILSVFCIVWMADIAAYAGGRAFGRRKLAPAISPGKSWEGAASGLVGVLVLAAVWLRVESSASPASPSVFALLYGWLGGAAGAIVLAGITAMSVVGDLFESLVKRAAGAKDSSQLLPGHGGVLDRIDALLPVLPITMAVAALSGSG